MKTKLKKSLSFLLVFIMLIVQIPLETITANAVTFDQLNASNVFLKQAGSTTCTLCATTMMMRRYSMLRGDSGWSSITESAIKSVAWINGTGLRYSFSYSNSSVNSISVGHYTLPGGSDNETLIQAELKKCPEGIVIYNESVPHAVLLTDYSNGTYYCADPSSGTENGRIPLTSSYKVRITNVTAYWKVTSPVVNGPTTGDTSTHTHSYTGSNFEKAHPHKVYKKCSCGKIQYTGSTKAYSECSTCMKVSSSYVHPVKAYTINTGKTVVYNKVSGTAKSNKIYDTDLCTISEVYDCGWCKVTFPLDSGGTETGYVKISVFMKSAGYGCYTSKQLTTYSRSDLKTSIGKAASGDKIYILGNTSSAVQIAYPLSSGGYKVGWVPISSISSTIKYNANGGTGTMSNQSVNYKSTLTLALNKFTRSGYAFSGWNVYRSSDKTWYVRGQG